jgi:hypothetical protein
MIYKYNKTWNIYSVITVANKCDNDKFPKMMVYQSLNDGQIYARPHKDFLNAFTLLGGEHV